MLIVLSLRVSLSFSVSLSVSVSLKHTHNTYITRKKQEKRDGAQVMAMIFSCFPYITQLDSIYMSLLQV